MMTISWSESLKKLICVLVKCLETTGHKNVSYFYFNHEGLYFLYYIHTYAMSKVLYLILNITMTSLVAYI